MKLSEYFLPTLKEDPSDAEVVSHKLMIRAGMIRKLASGIYSYLPYGLKAIQKVEKIIREEMEKAGAIEVLMPSVQPKELWEESGRWNYYGKELLRFVDRAGREFCYGPTHEEVITDLVRNNIRSYRDLPKNLFQIQTKFRDEIRPRFGVMRAREFIMKDGYSFDIDEESAERTYMKMYEAYCNIFKRCDLDFRAVEADTGNIGGSFSHEFMVIAESGEDTIFLCRHCNYSANKEKTEVGEKVCNININEELKPLEKIHTPNKKTIEEVSGFLNVPPTKLVKTVIYLVDSVLHMVLIRGDREANEIKVKNYLKANEIRLATNEEIENTLGIPVGFMGPYKLKNIRIIADISLKGLKNFVTGANETDYHLVNANFERDIHVNEYADISEAKDGDPCPRCDNGELYSKKGIEVGHIFKLGTKYSLAMNAFYLDEKGQEKPMIMGCYGIGVGRTVAASIEQNHDQDGIIFPIPLAPFQVIIVPLDIKNHEIIEVSNNLYKKFREIGIEVLIDDRDERPGVKFKDADLIGVPFRINIGNTYKKENKLEVFYRKTKEKNLMNFQEVIEFFKNKF
ncbi:MAG: proline--tRNA ligase [Proteobacteria bacterium]|nr:proline--tRNA ligase [Pseudomonadota bacterium]